MASKELVAPRQYGTLNDFYGWYYNLYLNSGKRIPTVPRRSCRIKPRTRTKLLGLIAEFDQRTTGIQDFGVGQGDEFSQKQIQKAQAISANLVVLADWVREMQAGLPDELKALEEVGVLVAIAAEWFDGVNCHHDVAKDLRERVDLAAEKVGEARSRMYESSGKRGILTQAMVDAYLGKRR
jgi:hypothetical protein